MTEQVDARKRPMGGVSALALMRGIDHIWATKGRDIVHLDLRFKKPDRKTLLGLLLGPTGHLRAPALRKGRTLIIGFDEDTYLRLLSS